MLNLLRFVVAFSVIAVQEWTLARSESLDEYVQSASGLEFQTYFNTVDSELDNGGIIPSNFYDRFTSLTHLTLSLELEGTIAEKLSQLSKLTHLELISPNFSGSLPSAITKLAQLTHLEVTSKGLTGTLPSNLLDRIILRHVLIYGTSVSGPLPETVWGPIMLNLSNNELTGTIPGADDIWAYDVDLSHNMLTGKLPQTMGLVTEINSFRVQGNKLSGTLNEDLLFALDEMRYLNIQDNMFNGTLPENIFTRARFSELYVGGNFFHGTMPSHEATNYDYKPGDRLRIVNDCSVTQGEAIYFESALKAHAEVRYPLEEITDITCRDKNLTGTFPSFISEMDLLSNMDIRDNDLTGTIPEDVFQNKRFVGLYVGDNWFSGTMPWHVKDIGDMREGEQFQIINDCTVPGTEVRSLALALELHSRDRYPLEKITRILCSGKALTGTIPSFISTMTSLSDLHLFSNDLSGTLSPRMFPNNLITLWVSDNQLSGTIAPDLFPPDLQRFFASGNKLTGTLPIGLTRSSEIDFIELQNNDLSGAIHDGVFEDHHLRRLYLGSNWFHGTMPQHNKVDGDVVSGEKFQIVNDCSEKQSGQSSLEEVLESHAAGRYSVEQVTRISCAGQSLTGTLPCFLYDMLSLEDLVLSDNQISGVLSQNLENLSSLQNIHLNGNSFSGSLPEAFNGLEDLQKLYLDSNNFNGVVPELPSSLVATDVVPGDVLFGEEAQHASCLITSAPSQFPTSLVTTESPVLPDVTTDSPVAEGSDAGPGGNAGVIIGLSVCGMLGVAVALSLFVRSRITKPKSNPSIPKKVEKPTLDALEEKLAVQSVENPAWNGITQAYDLREEDEEQEHYY